MYYSGKALAKFAGIVYTIHDIVGDVALAQAGLDKLKQSFERFSTNRQQFPLVYETAWSGLVSSASYTTLNSGADFGNTYYNDHHFHYSYFVYAAALIGYLDPTWLATHKDYINTLVRDYANPSPLDPYFPVSRNFDWYHGHSWAHGLYETFDGKNEESSSEDSLSAYALKMWGHVTGDANMEARGNLQLAGRCRIISCMNRTTTCSQQTSSGIRCLGSYLRIRSIIPRILGGMWRHSYVASAAAFDAHANAEVCD
ncbi:glycoside hydrolase family 81 protein [Rutstroemia sp. NJR-2017a BBW]|nr:glycoside hydrolase family 81 protein [Rutstroemia sp. NJR-2017a BBW]